MFKFSYNSQPLSYEGFKNCVRYAAVKFGFNFSISSKFSENNFRDTIIKDFALKLKAFDINVFDTRPNGLRQKKEFCIFRDSIVSDNTPILKLKFIDPRFTIPAILSFDSRLIAYCKFIKDSGSSERLSINDPFFLHLGVNNKTFYFDAFRFVVLSTIGGLDYINQVSIISEAYSEAFPHDNKPEVVTIDLIRNFTTQIHNTFFNDPNRSLYKVNESLIRLFKYSEVKAFNNIEVGNISKKISCFKIDPLICSVNIISKEISYESYGFFESSNFRFATKGYSSDFDPLKVYCEFLTVKFYEHIFSRVKVEKKFIFFLEDSIQSCLVDANNAQTLSSYFDWSLHNIYNLNLDVMTYFDLTWGEYPVQLVSPAVNNIKIIPLNENLLMQSSIINFCVLLALQQLIYNINYNNVQITIKPF
ncbi:hypothetical protein AB834_02330 [PVC group bacterium (ex Bugula neritina AB1)]|nr:hypothetical protein AB834_02330 [PVC group bacterium (ex Bugula neritina AB1)]